MHALIIQNYCSKPEKLLLLLSCRSYCIYFKEKHVRKLKKKKNEVNNEEQLKN